MTQTTQPVTGEEFDPEDRPSNLTANRPFSAIAEARLSRRGLLAGGMFAAAAGFLTTSVLRPLAAAAAPATSNLGFRAIPTSTADAVVVAPGYTARPFIPWGTPITGSYPPFRPGTAEEEGPAGNSAAEQAEQVGMHHDGITYFPLDGGSSTHGVLVLNHEYTDEFYLHRGTFVADYVPVSAEGVRKSQNAHGVSVVEIRRAASGRWEVVPSPLNRRITAGTPMRFSGPAAGHPLLQTKSDRSGTRPLGTVNNCGNGETPWGTYLTCEENFNGYFRVDGNQPAKDAELQERYGVGGDRNGWARHDPRFVVTTSDPNEPNRFGWVVEIDPTDPSSTPVKRTALGRLKHEDASVHEASDGRLVVYMGDDQVFEYLYKYVSAQPWRSVLAQGGSPLDDGTLYVARFDEAGTGTWIPLVQGLNGLLPRNGFKDQGDVLVKTRLAADTVGATPMDRPEWTAVDPASGTVYLTLTNNTARTTPNGPNPRALPTAGNRWGHIVRWDEDGGDHTATAFTWDLFLLAGPGGGADGSTVAAEDAFGSPDGLWVDPDRRAWIQTDGTQPDRSNNQMLAADARAAYGEEPEVRRFLVGPKQCEITGVATTPDRTTMFINVQHPGEGGGSSWPDGGSSTPRSATVVVTKDDGGVVGT